MMQHLIKKQIIQLQAADSSGVYRLQQEASQFYYTNVIPVLEKIFDELSSEDQVITFDRLEIDLGSLSLRHNTSFSENELYTLLHKQFKDAVMESKSSSSEKLFSSQASGSGKTPVAHAFDQWLYYMEHGILSWNTREINDTLRNNVLETLSTDLTAVHRLTETIRQHPASVVRIVRLHIELFLVHLIEAITAKEQTTLPQLIHSLEALLPAITQMEAAEKLWTAVLTVTTEKSVQKNTNQLLQRALAMAQLTSGHTKSQLVAIAEEKKELKPILFPFIYSETIISKAQQASISEKLKNTLLPKQEKNEKRKTLKKSKDENQTSEKSKDALNRNRKNETLLNPESAPAENPDQLSTENSTAIALREQVDQQSKNSNSEFKKEERNDQQKEKEKMEMEINFRSTATEKISTPETEADFQKATADLLEDGIFIQHAGLILLHPFYQFLFRNTGLTKGGVFIDKQAQQKAIYLLHYIATGETKAEEHLLAQPKIICGWPLTEPVVKDAELTETMLTEADDLIRAAIAQWTILKNTSMEGLRESFLQREGKVFTKADKLYIQVEKKSIDILLDHLPWNTSIVKFPWLKNIIWVEWR